MGSVPSSWTMRISALEAHALAISSTAICSISVPVPVPPCSSLKGSASTSLSASSRRTSHGYSAVCVDLAGARRDALGGDLADVSRKSRNSCGIS